MKNIFITARSVADEFERYLSPSLQRLKTKCVNVSDKEGTEPKPIGSKYNVGLNILKEQNLLTTDTIVVFAKPNAHIMDGLFLSKLDMVFTERPEVGVLGVVGVKEIHSGRTLYGAENKPVNGIVYSNESNPSEGSHIQFSNSGYFKDIVAVDDSVFAVRGELLLKNNFQFKSLGDVGMGIDVSIQAIESGYEVAVADMLVVSSKNTDVSQEDVLAVVETLGVDFPVNSKTLGQVVNSVIDIEI